MTQVYFKKQPVELEKALPNVGSKIHNFEFTLQNLTDHDLSFFQGNKMILWFVPSLDTGVCIMSAKKINEHLKKHPGYKALILSVDLPFAQSRICGLEHLEHVSTGSLFRHQESLSHLGLLIKTGPLKGLSARACIVLDSHHNITYMQLGEEITEELDYSKLFHHIDKS
jgi:thioredoxin-dependent peroxiredoxin